MQKRRMAALCVLILNCTMYKTMYLHCDSRHWQDKKCAALENYNYKFVLCLVNRLLSEYRILLIVC